jgi:hypothetical protein
MAQRQVRWEARFGSTLNCVRQCQRNLRHSTWNPCRLPCTFEPQPSYFFQHCDRLPPPPRVFGRAEAQSAQLPFVCRFRALKASDHMTRSTLMLQYLPSGVLPNPEAGKSSACRDIRPNRLALDPVSSAQLGR